MEKVYDPGYLEKAIQVTRTIKDHSYNLIPRNAELILEAGCGTGYDAINIAKRSPQSQVIGIDIGPEMIMVARESAQKAELNNITFSEASVYTLPFDDNYFDAIRIERVLQHLDKGNLAFAELLRVLKPGGILVAIETDWNSLSFYDPFIQLHRTTVDYLCKSFVTDGYAARKFPSYFTQTGFKNLHSQIFPFSFDDFHLMSGLIKFKELTEKMLDENKIDQIQLADWTRVMENYSKDHIFQAAANMILMTGIK